MLIGTSGRSRTVLSHVADASNILINIVIKRRGRQFTGSPPASSSRRFARVRARTRFCLFSSLFFPLSVCSFYEQPRASSDQARPVTHVCRRIIPSCGRNCGRHIVDPPCGIETFRGDVLHWPSDYANAIK